MPRSSFFIADIFTALCDRIDYNRTLSHTDNTSARKNFSLGSFTAYVAHPDAGFISTKHGWDYNAFSAWEFFAMAQLQISERFGLDLGAQVYAGDNSELFSEDGKLGLSFDSMWTIFGGVRFSFNNAIDLRAIIYHQQYNGDEWDSALSSWRDLDADSTNAWRAILYLRQEALKFTSAWIEYGHYDAGFAMPLGSQWVVASNVSLGDIIPDDLNYWRVILGQKWNEKWYTHLFFFNYDLDTQDDFKEYGGGITYKLNDSVRFGLNFAKTDWDDGRKDDNFIRFRTEINF